MDALKIKEFESLYVRPKDGRALVVGSRVYEGRTDRRRNYKRALGVDMLAGEGVDLVHDMELFLPVYAGKFDHVDCMSVLEHCRKPWHVAESIEYAMVSGATLFVTSPFVWRVHAYPNDFWRFTIDGIRELFPKIKFSALMYGNRVLSEGPTIPMHSVTDEALFVERTEVFGFGVRV